MKKLNTFSIILICTIAVCVALMILFAYIPFDVRHHFFYVNSFLSSSQPIFHLYIRILIFAITLFLIVFLYKNSVTLKKEIHRRKEVERESIEKGNRLEEALALSRATLEATADGILVVDRNRRVVGHNERAAKMWKVPSKVLRPGNDEEAAQYVMRQLKDPAKFIAGLERLYNAEPGKEIKDEIEFNDGRIFERYTMPQMRDNEIIGRVFSFRDITQQKAMEEQLIQQATHDALTSLPNRIILHDRIQQELRYSKRSNKIAAVLFFDLDDFKLINDSLGHDFGDILLQSVARRLERCVREQDTVARWGGDEFVILLTSLYQEAEIVPIVRKCLEAIEAPFVIDKHTVSITSSVGITILPRDGTTVAALLKNADSAMYNAKFSGRNNYKFYSLEMNRNTQHKLELINDLHEALETNQLKLHYQPIIDIQSASIVGAEALLRWYHPKKGLISPQEFIPIAEETGLILPIGEWVLRNACLQNMSWQQEELRPITIAINLSGQQFKQRNIIELVINILKETKMDAKYLDLELTESVIMENSQIFLNYLLELKRLGVGLVIDDFGTGYSSLSYLKRFPVDKLKIDISFISGLPQDADDAAIVRAILAMAQQLNIKVVAEGVETRDQFSFLRNSSCNMCQGFLFSKAVPPPEFSAMLKKNKFKNLSGITNTLIETAKTSNQPEMTS
ncbi:MAG TPA: EAL domain-containing protein [Alphaproteobacteria bacterium]|nr:EAL domain-containing protein [Alphaproteobacteria bacterium]